MRKTVVNLSEIPAWEIGKWYYLTKDGMIGWYNLVELTIDATFPLSLMRHAGRTATLEGKHMGNDPARNVLEPWEALILHPECINTAPVGVDWSAPELTLPKCLTKDEFEALEDDTMIFWCGNSFVLDGPKNGLDFWSGSELESAFFLTKADAETFKELYEADEIEFSEGTWVTAGTQSEISKLRTLIQFLGTKNTELLHDCARLQSKNADLIEKNTEISGLEALLQEQKDIVSSLRVERAALTKENAELLAENQSLEYANNILKNDCDSYEKETIALRDVVDLLTAQNKSMATTFDGLHSKFDKAVYELTLAKEIIANLAIRLQKHEDI